MAFAKNTLRNQWYEYNDTHVTPVSTGTVAGAEGYVLFYRCSCIALCNLCCVQCVIGMHGVSLV